MKETVSASAMTPARPTQGSASAKGAAPRIDQRMTIRRPKRERTARDGSERAHHKEAKECILRAVYVEPEGVDQVEREEVLKRRDVDLLREHQYEKHRKERDESALRESETGRSGSPLFLGFLGEDALAQFERDTFATDPDKKARGKGRHGRKPRYARLSVGDNDKGGGQRPHGHAGVAANLEDRLCESLSSARSELRNARRLGMKDRGTAPDQCDREKNRRERRGAPQENEPRKREAHPERKRIAGRMPVGRETHNGLQERTRDLHDERDEAHFGKGKTMCVAQNRQRRRNDGTDPVIEEMPEADRCEKPDSHAASCRCRTILTDFHPRSALLFRLGRRKPTGTPYA